MTSLLRIVGKLLLCLSIVTCGKAQRLIENEEDIITKMLEQISIVEHSDDELLFFHVSDTHGDCTTLDRVSLLSEYCSASFCLLTGDVAYNGSIKEVVSSSKIPFFLLPGNHDIYDPGNTFGQSAFRKVVLDSSPYSALMHFGSERGNYYYVDFEDDLKKVRLICLDQYEIEGSEGLPLYYIVMTQRQVDWFIKTLEDCSDFDLVIVAVHSGFGNSIYAKRDINNTNLFISSKAKNNPDSYEYYGYGDPRLIPEIVNSYQLGTSISKQFKSGLLGEMIDVETHFDKPHSNFVAYFAGHTHWDVIEPLNDYPKQLQSIVAIANPSLPSIFDDLVRSSSGINAITVNACCISPSKRTIQFVRIGTRETIDGRCRDTITYTF